MLKNKMDIKILGCDYKSQGAWYQDESINRLLEEMVDKLGCLQCTYQNHILVFSKAGRAVFDLDGKLIELYDLLGSPEVNIADKNHSKDLEFEMVLLFSKINE